MPVDAEINWYHHTCSTDVQIMFGSNTVVCN